MSHYQHLHIGSGRMPGLSKILSILLLNTENGLVVFTQVGVGGLGAGEITSA